MSSTRVAALVAGVSAAALGAAQTPNLRPIIGILSLPNDVPGYSQFTSYFAASYVKFLESGGARVVPIPYTLPPDQLASLLKSINGALFTGGAASFFDDKTGQLTPYAQTAQLIFQEVVDAANAGESWPLWGTCLGHELLLTLAAGADPNLLSSPFDSENISWPLIPTPVARNESRLWGSAPPDVWQYLTTEYITMNSHQAGVAPSDFAANPTLVKAMKVLSVGYDRGGKPFVSSAEGLTLPLFSTQFHPEKPLFEWWSTQNVNHTFHSVVGNSYVPRFFVEQARMNSRQFPSPAAEAAALIYNYEATYSAQADPSFQQVYFFS